MEAMIQCGMGQEAKEKLTSYCGGMVKKAADTFWEVYDPQNDFLSPYNSYPVNSYYHAWSCTPVFYQEISGAVSAVEQETCCIKKPPLAMRNVHYRFFSHFRASRSVSKNFTFNLRLEKSI